MLIIVKIKRFLGGYVEYYNLVFFYYHFLGWEDESVKNGIHNIVEVYVKEKYLFPNNYLEEAEQFQSISNNHEYDIYMVIKGDRYEIISLEDRGDTLSVTILNFTQNIKYIVNINILGVFKVPSYSHLKVTLLDKGKILKYEYSQKGVSYIKKYNSEEYKIYEERIKRFGCFWDVIYVKNLVDLGQSKRKSIYQRLNNHSTIQDIMRKEQRNAQNNDLYILIFSLDGICSEPFLTYFVNIDHLIDVVEAMLIRQFKPYFNKRFKNQDNLDKLEAYKRIKSLKIDQLEFTMDLFFEDSGETVILETEFAKTETKIAQTICKFAEEKTKVEPDKINDDYYDSF